MLVLSRKVTERLIIGNNITIVVSRIAGNRVILGVEAPDEIPILRGELKLKDGAKDDQTKPNEATGALESSTH